MDTPTIVMLSVMIATYGTLVVFAFLYLRERSKRIYQENVTKNLAFRAEKEKEDADALADKVDDHHRAKMRTEKLLHEKQDALDDIANKCRVQANDPNNGQIIYLTKEEIIQGDLRRLAKDE